MSIQRPTLDVPADCPLTESEYNTMVLIADGKTYKQAALDLGIAVSTVRTHVHNSLKKLNVTESRQAAVLFMQRGWHIKRAGQPIVTEEQIIVIKQKHVDAPPFATVYLNSLDRHLKDGDDKQANRDLAIAASGLTGRKAKGRNAKTRDDFLNEVIKGMVGSIRG